MSKATISASRKVKNVFFYETPTTVKFNPYIFVDIGYVIEKKFQALKSHVSQVNRTNVEGLSVVEVAHAKSVFRGIQARVKHAEAFVASRYFIEFS